MHTLSNYRHILVFLLLICLVPLHAERLLLPASTLGQDPLTRWLTPTTTSDWRMESRGHAGAGNSAAPLWVAIDDDRSVESVGTGDAWAQYQYNYWIGAENNRWIVAIGKGKREMFTGNHDAAQLALDLHQDRERLPDYHPEATQRQVKYTWYGIGRRFPLGRARHRASGEVFVRVMHVDDFYSRSLTGDIDGDDFSGIVRTAKDGARGLGWSLDARIAMQFSDHWHASAAVESIAGEMKWKNLHFNEDYVLSPRVFTDSDGFLNDIGGISGVEWKQDFTIKLDPTYRVDVISSTEPMLLFSVSGSMYGNAIPSAGIALPQHGWLPYARVYPTEGNIELGITGKGWSCAAIGDGWLTTDAKKAQLYLSATALSF